MLLLCFADTNVKIFKKSNNMHFSVSYSIIFNFVCNIIEHFLRKKFKITLNTERLTCAKYVYDSFFINGLGEILKIVKYIVVPDV